MTKNLFWRCHGEENNVVYDLVKDLNLLQTLSIKSDVIPYRNSNGTIIDPEKTKKLLELGSSIIDDTVDMSRHNGSVGNYFMDK